MEVKIEEKFDYDFSLLPAHIVAKIFVYLDKKSFTPACLVCQNWLYASYDPMVSRTIQVYINAKRVNQLNAYTNQIRPFNRLKIVSCNFKESPNLLLFFKNFGSKIYELELNSCALSKDQILQIVLHAKNLTKLHLINVFHFKADIRLKMSDHMRFAINNTLNNIKVFEVESNHLTTMTSVSEEILVNLKNLQVLIFILNSVYESGLYDFQRLVDAINGWEDGKLRELYLVGDFVNASTTGGFYRTISKLKTTALKKMHIGKFFRRNCRAPFRGYWDGSFTMFCKTFSNLEELRIDGINMRELGELFDHMVNLKSLKIRNGDIDHYTGIEKLKFLEELSISDPVNGSHPKIQELFTNNLLNLKILHVLQYNIDKLSLELICQNFKNLTDLRLQCLTTDECECIFTSLLNLRTVHLYFDCTVNRECDVSGLTQLQEIWISGNRLDIKNGRIRVTPMFRCRH